MPQLHLPHHPPPPHSSADFSYDPLSYALNFHDDDDHHPMNFSTRLPTSPAPTRIQPTTTPFDHHNLPRTPPIPTSPDQEFVNPKIEAVTDDLRRGFEALSLNMKRTEEPPANLIIGSQTTNNTELSSSSSPRAASVRRSLDPDQDPMSPVGMSSNRNVLVQLC
ncbi:hypothetical protein Salat_2648500 [Sesamum alatum]|uniref:Uncharacterized protein n=1 Tax=Sesamum alatum TaxID=300844 RepID=A0AAE1XQ26_9LAMI|nr:hypothetical protein Salat_2648500 [Sesamum alatum]